MMKMGEIGASARYQYAEPSATSILESARSLLEMPQGEMRAKDLRREGAELRSVRPDS
jgi:hypothetical protein